MHSGNKLDNIDFPTFKGKLPLSLSLSVGARALVYSIARLSVQAYNRTDVSTLLSDVL